MDDAKGGAERVLADITSGLADKGHDISLLTFDRPGGTSFYPLHAKIRRICLGIGNTHQKSTVTQMCARMKALRNTVKAEHPDVIVALMHSMFVPMSLALAGTGIPVIASEHIVPEHYKTRRFEFLLLLVSSFFLKYMAVLSENIKTSYPRFLHKKMVAIANPVHEVDTLADPAGEKDARNIILNVGRLDLQKDQKTLIKAFAKLAPDYPDWDVRIMGDGVLRNDLERLVNECGLEDRIFLAGSTPYIALEYQKAHIFALPSAYESFGLATAEAMAHGLPAIGFASCPGTNELIVDGENGLLVEGDDRIQAFSVALEKMMASPDLRLMLGKKAQQSVKPFHPESIVEKWNDLVKSLVC